MTVYVQMLRRFPPPRARQTFWQLNWCTNVGSRVHAGVGALTTCSRPYFEIDPPNERKTARALRGLSWFGIATRSRMRRVPGERLPLDYQRSPGPGAKASSAAMATPAPSAKPSASPLSVWPLPAALVDRYGRGIWGSGDCAFVKQPSAFCRRLNHWMAAADLSNIVLVFTMILIRSTNTDALQCAQNCRHPRLRIPFALLFDKGRQRVRIISNSAPQLVIGQI